MSQKTTQNRIYELAELLEKKEIVPSEIKDRETRDMLIWYLRVDQGKSITDIAILLQCERRTVSEAIKRTTKQRAVQLEKEGIDLYTEFIKFKKGIELLKDRALAKGDLAIYLKSITTYMQELRKCGFLTAIQTSDQTNIQFNVDNIHLFINEILEQFSAIPESRLEEIASHHRNKR